MLPIFRCVAGATLALVFAGVMQLSFFVGGYSSLDDSCATPLFVALAAGGALGVLFAQMILERTARVWKSAWKSSLFTVCFFAVFVAGCSFDVLGVSRYVPDEGTVRSVSVSASDGNYGNWSNTKVDSAGGEAMEKLESLLNCDEVQGEWRRSLLPLSSYNAYVYLDRDYVNADVSSVESVDFMPEESIDFLDNALKTDVIENGACMVSIMEAAAPGKSLGIRVHVADYAQGSWNIELNTERTPRCIAWLEEHKGVSLT